ncbi:sel1 repeat family protein [Entomomonas moraniae]|uniref:Sel1 repeat family protein n=1 Tax=Entomomonas moraniae TaxID=2213226 RepID=A0A3Q9JJ63_9GAMM|nr:tetratricopeptide repeat protein [Entomomonas moraniae]AZS50719.1 sel1 repeat family protein [Entomomonas moraniae]
MKFLIIIIIAIVIILGIKTYNQEQWQKDAMSDTWYDSHPEETAILISRCKDQKATLQACEAVKQFKENNLSLSEIYAIFQRGQQSLDQKNYQEAMKYYLKAAKYNNFDAINNIGYMYSHGLGVEKNPQKAFQWFLKAAKLGNPMSMYAVGIDYYYGKGTPKDITKAKEWLSKSANAGYSDAKNFLNQIQ